MVGWEPTLSSSKIFLAKSSNKRITDRETTNDFNLKLVELMKHFAPAYERVLLSMPQRAVKFLTNLFTICPSVLN